MVDKENQWENIEYSDEQGTSGTYEYEDVADNGSNSMDNDQNAEYDSYEDYEEDDEEPTQKKNNPLPLLIVFLLLLGAGAYIAVPKLVGNFKATSENVQTENVSQVNDIGTSVTPQNGSDLANSFFSDASSESSDMMSVNFNENGETNVVTGEGENVQTATVTDVSSSEGVSETDLFENQDSQTSSNNEDNNSIMVVYNKAARLNPFKPPVVDKSLDQAYETINDTQFEIIEPPVTSVPDENLTKLLQTQISGILYDSESPSAIINLNGLDQFVKAGDTISGYKIESITKDKVQISYKNNSYVASVGELFTRGSLEKQPAVVNLENKFAGRYKNKE